MWRRRNARPHARLCRTRGRSCSLASCSCAPFVLSLTWPVYLEHHKHNLLSDSPHAVRGNEGRALFGGAVHIDGHFLPVPMQLLGRIGIVVDVHCGLLAFFETQQWPRKLTVISSERDDPLRSNLDRRCFDVQRVIRRTCPVWLTGGGIALCQHHTLSNTSLRRD